MKRAVGYLRVSTKEQGRSGLSLAAQRFDIEAFGTREGFRLRSWYQDVQTGAGKDPLTLRPGLATALKEAKAAHCPLIVSRLDRLSRNVHFIATLMEHKVHFVVAQLGRDCDEFTLHIYACLAEQERNLISERAKAASDVARRRGRKFGLQLRSRAWQRRISALGRAVIVQEAINRPRAYRVHIEWALKQPGLDGGPISYRAAANKLNARDIASPTGQRILAGVSTEIPDITGLRDRALIGVMVYTFARVNAVLQMKVRDYFVQGRRGWVRLHEKGGKEHELPCHHNLELYLDEYIAAAGIAGDRDGSLFRTTGRKTGQQQKMWQQDAHRMIQRRSAAVGLKTRIGNHTFRATDITAYLKNAGTLEHAQTMANHSSPRTTKLYDRRQDDISLDEVERIVI